MTEPLRSSRGEHRALGCRSRRLRTTQSKTTVVRVPDACPAGNICRRGARRNTEPAPRVEDIACTCRSTARWFALARAAPPFTLVLSPTSDSIMVALCRHWTRSQQQQTSATVPVLRQASQAMYPAPRKAPHPAPDVPAICDRARHCARGWNSLRCGKHPSHSGCAMKWAFAHCQDFDPHQEKSSIPRPCIALTAPQCEDEYSI